MIPAQLFIDRMLTRMESYKQLGDKCFTQLQADDFYYCPHEESNSIAVIIQHLYGNMMSRFSDFLTEDGEKPWRQRDAEFAQMEIGHTELVEMWNAGWLQVMSTIRSLKEEDLVRDVTIRGEKMPAFDALLRQLGHYPYHVGQIVYIAKMLKGADFVSLSIPKGGSDVYNRQMKQ